MFCSLWLLISSFRLQLTLSFRFDHSSLRCRIWGKTNNENHMSLPCDLEWLISPQAVSRISSPQFNRNWFLWERSCTWNNLIHLERKKKKKKKNVVLPWVSNLLIQTDNVLKHRVPAVILVISPGYYKRKWIYFPIFHAIRLRPTLLLGRGLHTVYTLLEIPLLAWRCLTSFMCCTLFRLTGANQ